MFLPNKTVETAKVKKLTSLLSEVFTCIKKLQEKKI